MAPVASNPVQVNLGTLNLNAWQQIMLLNGTQVNTDAVATAHVLAPLVMGGYALSVLLDTAANGVTVTTRTAAQLFQDIVTIMGQIPAPGMSWEFEIANSSGGTTTLAAGAGVTLVGANNSVTTGNNRVWVLTYTGGGTASPNAGNPTFTLQSFASRNN